MVDLSEIRSKITSGEKRIAQRELARLLKEQPTNMDAWQLMAQVVDDVQKKSDCYRKILEIDPENAQAKDRLGWLYSQPALTAEFEIPAENPVQKNPAVEEVLEPLGGLPELPGPIKKKRRSAKKPRRWVVLSSFGLGLGILVILAIALLPSPVQNPAAAIAGQAHTEESPAGIFPATTQSDATLSAQAPDMRVIYAKDGQLWQWQGGESSGISPAGPDITGFEISPDGKQIAFLRDGNLWLMESRGGNAKQIVYSSLLPRVEQSGSSASRRVCHMVWSADSSLIFFNSCSEGIEYYDLHRVTVEKAEVSLVLPDGEGGLAHPSPSGDWVVSVSPEEIHLTHMASLDSSDVFFYEKVLVNDADQWLAPIAWSADSSFLFTAISPASGKNEPNTPIRIWKIPVNATPPQIMGELFSQGGNVFLSPSPNGALFFLQSSNQESAGLHWFDALNGRESLLAPIATHPLCWTQTGQEYAVFKAGVPPALLTGTIGARDVLENQTGLSSTFAIEHVICLGSGYVLVDGRDDLSWYVWLIGQGIDPILVLEGSPEEPLLYKVFR